eukprot:361929-Chlamydomonas_euryale.AAC.7
MAVLDQKPTSTRGCLDSFGPTLFVTSLGVAQWWLAPMPRDMARLLRLSAPQLEIKSNLT